MSVQSQIDRIESNIAAAYTAAAAKGATMPATQNSDNLATAISSISSASDAADYVVAQGKKTNWYYRKWNSGVAECWRTLSISGYSCNTAINTAAGSWYRTALIAAGTYPFTFTETPNLQMFFETDTGTGGIVWPAGTAEDDNPKTRPHKFYIIRMTSLTSISGKVHFQVKGKWK